VPLLAALIGAFHGGLFTCVDVALTSVSTARLRALQKQARPRFRGAVRRATKHREIVQVRYLSGRVLMLCLAIAGYTLWVVEQSATVPQQAVLAGIGILVIGVLVYSAAALGRRAADWVITYGLYSLRPLELLIAPVAEALRTLTRLIPRLHRKADPRITETEVEIMVNQSERAGTLKREPAEMIRNLLEFSDLTARDAMVPRIRVTAIKLDTPLPRVLETIIETGHSRYPVYREEIDDVFGLLYAKDLFQTMSGSLRPPPGTAADHSPPGETFNAQQAVLLDIVREPINIVAESQPLSNLLREMRQDRQHLGIVVDEFGDVSGIVTLEDVLEEIVGDIQDEFDTEETLIVELGPDRLMADAAVLLSDLSAYLGSELDPEGQYDSLGGMLTDKIGKVPTVGTTIPAYGMRFIVRESDEKHVSKVEVIYPKLVTADASGPHSAA